MQSKRLKKSLSLWMIISFGASGIIGTSWVYTTSSFFAKYGAGGVIFGFVVAGLLATCIALAYSELTQRFPRAGGETVFAHVAFGKKWSFVVGWLLVGAYVSSLAFYVTASGMLLSLFFPVLNTFPLYTLAGTTIHLPVLLIGVVLTLFIFCFSAIGIELAGWLQMILFGFMLIIGLCLVMVGFSSGNIDNFWPAFTPNSNAIVSTLHFVLPAMTLLTGFSIVSVLAEDANLKPKSISIALLMTVFIATAFYFLVLLASAWLIPWKVTATMHYGVIDAFRLAGFPDLAWGAYAIAALGLVTSFLALFSATSRVILSMGRTGILPPIFARLNRNDKPINALLFTLGLTLGLGLLGKGALLWFLDTGGVYIGLAWVIAVLSLYRIRRIYPQTMTPFQTRTRWLPAIGGFIALATIAMIAIPGTSLSLVWPNEYIILGVWALLGFTLYRFVPSEAPGEHTSSQYEMQ
ncbi:APC family permease [Vibrio sp. S4M6]|uniref:APC family permease n=1 Tax=Vibrio sinus TaxID=2946865 RepID=UPI002029FDFA|nr:APC family permease [Vibrio sinus]MCL9779916.1 APC family permease [Vibrio sinus]